MAPPKPVEEDPPVRRWKAMLGSWRPLSKQKPVVRRRQNTRTEAKVLHKEKKNLKGL